MTRTDKPLSWAVRLVCDDRKKNLSLGRVAFWLVFGLAVYFWLGRPAAEFPPSLVEILMSCLAYNLGSKGINTFGRPRVSAREPAGEGEGDL
jgi:hypothetical protein